MLIWRCCLEAPFEPDPLLCLAMSSLTHGLLLCVPPSAFGGCPSPPWENTKQSKTKLLHAFWRILETVQNMAWLNHKAYFSWRRQLCRLLRGSLLTEVDGFSNSSNREAGTGQSGILTGVTGLDGFPSLFSSMRCCSNKTIITGKFFITKLCQATQSWHYMPWRESLWKSPKMDRGNLDALPSWHGSVWAPVWVAGSAAGPSSCCSSAHPLWPAAWTCPSWCCSAPPAQTPAPPWCSVTENNPCWLESLWKRGRWL